MAETKTLEIRTGRARPVGIWHLFAGIIMAALGVYVWFNPVATMVALALYIGIIFIILGAGYITASFRYDSGYKPQIYNHLQKNNSPLYLFVQNPRFRNSKQSTDEGPDSSPLDQSDRNKKSEENGETPENRKVYPNKFFSYPSRTTRK